MTLWPKIKKLLLAMRMRGQVYMVNREQCFSAAKGRVYGVLVLNCIMPVEEYNEQHPDKPKNPKKVDFVKVEVMRAFKESDILLQLVAAYKGGEGG